MLKARIYHNPRCSKSREALALLESRGVELEVVRYLEVPPGREELTALLGLLGLEPLQLIRTGEERFEELGLREDDVRPREEWLELLQANPILLQRPVVVVGERAVIGRPPERVLELLEG